MAQILTLNPRANAVIYDEQEVAEVAELLADVRTGEAVALDAVDSEGKARARTRVMKQLLKEYHDLDVRGHIIEEGEGDNVAFYPAVSLRPAKSATSDNGKGNAKSK